MHLHLRFHFHTRTTVTHHTIKLWALRPAGGGGGQNHNGGGSVLAAALQGGGEGTIRNPYNKTRHARVPVCVRGRRPTTIRGPVNTSMFDESLGSKPRLERHMRRSASLLTCYSEWGGRRQGRHAEGNAEGGRGGYVQSTLRETQARTTDVRPNGAIQRPSHWSRYRRLRLGVDVCWPNPASQPRGMLLTKKPWPVGGSLITWKSRRQSIMTTSTAKTELKEDVGAHLQGRMLQYSWPKRTRR